MFFLSSIPDFGTSDHHRLKPMNGNARCRIYIITIVYVRLCISKMYLLILIVIILLFCSVHVRVIEIKDHQSLSFLLNDDKQFPAVTNVRWRVYSDLLFLVIWIADSRHLDDLAVKAPRLWPLCVLSLGRHGHGQNWHVFGDRWGGRDVYMVHAVGVGVGCVGVRCLDKVEEACVIHVWVAHKMQVSWRGRFWLWGNDVSAP